MRARDVISVGRNVVAGVAADTARRLRPHASVWPERGFRDGGHASVVWPAMGVTAKDAAMGPKLPTGLPRVSPDTYRRLALATLVALVLIIVIGTAVRLTGSGLGCPSWPSCEPDRLTPRSASNYAGVIESGNRLAGGVVGMLALATVGAAHLRSPRRPDLFRLSLVVAALVMANGMLGAQVVWLHLSPIVVAGHFLLALVALGAGVLLHHRATEAAAVGSDSASPRRRPTCTPRFRRAVNGLVLAAVLTVIAGTVVTGSGPHAGDEDAERLSFAVGEVARIHGIAAVLLLGVALLVLWMAQRGDAAAGLEDRLQALVLVLVLQGVVGYTQYFTGVPPVLVGAHVLGSALVWVAVLRVRLGLSEPVPPARDATTLARGSPAMQHAIAQGDAHVRDWN